jgi:large subunit ribosomal protein L17
MRNLSTALLDKEKITTTLAKAKELRRFAERLVTLSKKETLHARRLVSRHVHDRKVVAKLFDTLSARYATRPGGYTRILKLGPRRGDNAEMALIELVGAQSETAEEKPSKPKRKSKPAKRAPAKKPAAKAPASKKSTPKKKETERKTKATAEGSKKSARTKTGKKRSSKA